MSIYSQWYPVLVSHACRVRGREFCEPGSWFVLHTCESFAENWGHLQRLQVSPSKWPTIIAEICGDYKSAQKLRRNMPKSWLVKFPSSGRPSRPTPWRRCESQQNWAKLAVSGWMSGVSRIRFSPSYESFWYDSIILRFNNSCVDVSSNLGPLTVFVKQYPWNPQEWAAGTRWCLCLPTRRSHGPEALAA